MRDRRLVAEYLETGNDDLFGELVERYKGRVCRVAAAILGPGFAADAEDVAQEVFLQVHRSLEGFRGDSAFHTWLFSIARRKAIDCKRGARFRYPHLEDEGRLDAKRGSMVGDRAAAGAELRQLLGPSLDRLPDRYRAAIHLYYWMGCSVPETAELLGVQSGTIKSWLYRARIMIQRDPKKRGVHHAP